MVLSISHLRKLVHISALLTVKKKEYLVQLYIPNTIMIVKFSRSATNISFIVYELPVQSVLQGSAVLTFS